MLSTLHYCISNNKFLWNNKTQWNINIQNFKFTIKLLKNIYINNNNNENLINNYNHKFDIQSENYKRLSYILLEIINNHLTIDTYDKSHLKILINEFIKESEKNKDFNFTSINDNINPSIVYELNTIEMKNSLKTLKGISQLLKTSNNIDYNEDTLKEKLEGKLFSYQLP